MADPQSPRLRVLLGSATSLGPGKADLLQAIAETGSIAAAGRRMGMSSKRAWRLVEAMNRGFRAPWVAAAKGGRRGGGAALTPLGREVLGRYRAMEARATEATAEEMAAFRALMQGDAPPQG